MKTSKWFEFEGKDFSSKQKARSLREAFDKSIEKWQLICKGFSPDDYDVETCGLCDLYWDNNCIACPIFKTTNTGYCKATPFYEWSEGPTVKTARRELHFIEFIKKEFQKK